MRNPASSETIIGIIRNGINAELGNAIAEQFEDVASGGALEDQNGNALGLIEQWLDENAANYHSIFSAEAYDELLEISELFETEDD